MNEYEIYPQQLLCLGNGLALFEPNPAGRYDKVRTSDVGYILEGAFHRLFNITYPGDHIINELGVPEGFEPLKLPARATYAREALAEGVRCSETVSSRGGDTDATVGQGIPVQAGASVHLSCCNKLGAALITSHPAYRLDLNPVLAFKRYMLKHYSSWVMFARDRLFRDVNVKDIILVTGRDLTKQWATAIFIQKSWNSEISFQVGDGLGSMLGQAGFSFWGEWSENFDVPVRHGPKPVALPQVGNTSRLLVGGSNNHLAAETTHNEYNQCVFIRGFRIRERILRPPKVIKAAAEGAGGDNFEDDDAPPSPSSMSVDLDSDLDSSMENVQIERIQDIPGRDPQVDRDMYDVMARFIFENSDADVALLHDNEICEPFKRNVIETLEELMETLRVGMKETARVDVEVVDGVKVGHWVPPPEQPSDASHKPSAAETLEMGVDKDTAGKLAAVNSGESDSLSHIVRRLRAIVEGLELMDAIAVEIVHPGCALGNSH